MATAIHNTFIAQTDPSETSGTEQDQPRTLYLNEPRTNPEFTSSKYSEKRSIQKSPRQTVQYVVSTLEITHSHKHKLTQTHESAQTDTHAYTHTHTHTLFFLMHK